MSNNDKCNRLRSIDFYWANPRHHSIEFKRTTRGLSLFIKLVNDDDGVDKICPVWTSRMDDSEILNRPRNDQVSNRGMYCVVEEKTMTVAIDLKAGNVNINAHYSVQLRSLLATMGSER